MFLSQGVSHSVGRAGVCAAGLLIGACLMVNVAGCASLQQQTSDLVDVVETETPVSTVASTSASNESRANASELSGEPIKCEQIFYRIHFQIAGMTTSLSQLVLWPKLDDDAPGIVQVNFADRRYSQQYAVELLNGETLDVYVGHQKTEGTYRALGIWKREMYDGIVGFVMRGNEEVARMAIEPRRLSLGGTTRPFSDGERRKLTTIHSQLGTIDHDVVARKVVHEKLLDKLFKSPLTLRFEYRLGNEVLATREDWKVWFADDLPEELRGCIAARMAYEMMGEISDENVERTDGNLIAIRRLAQAIPK